LQDQLSECKRVAAAIRTLTCTICMDELAVGRGVQCGTMANTKRHFTCDGCLESHVQVFIESTVESPDLLRQREGHIYCPLRGHGCTHDIPFARTLLAQHVSEECFELSLGARDRRAEQRAFEDVQEQLAKEERELREGQEKEREQELVASRAALAERMLAEQFRRSMPNARMCGSCSFGPVEHGGCGDLGAHHGETHGGRARVSNACPNCGWFTTQIRDWPMWDGKLDRRGAASSA
jgi:hypothetical protein